MNNTDKKNCSTKKIKAGITVFPGSNCDYDVYGVLTRIFGIDASFIWHKDKIKSLSEYDFIVIPGGFSYGDYLRSGALAARSLIMDALKTYASKGGIILGICNGFQILLESGLLKGVMLPNSSLKFECKDVFLKVMRTDTPFTCSLEEGAVLRMPIAHHDGNYFGNSGVIGGIKKNNGILFKYCDSDGSITVNSNPNGSLLNIAGILSEKGNVMGLMPHPERSSESVLGSEDGGYIFKSIIKFVCEKK